MTPYPVVEVVWEDSSFQFGPWHDEGLEHFTTVGWLVGNTGEYISVALSVAGGNGPYDTMTIPQKNVLSILTLREGGGQQWPTSS